MSTEVKYTSDGRKVVVLGSLNSQQKIVQEIFVVDGSEIPSGEHFVVNSLHDSPAISYKEKALKDLEERYETEKKNLTQKITLLREDYEKTSIVLREKLSYFKKVIQNVGENSFQRLLDFITGEIKYVVTTGYTPELLSMEEFHKLYERKLRLVSLFGQDDGSFTYALEQYTDGSSYHKHYFKPCKTYEEALEVLKEVCCKGSITYIQMDLAKKYNFELPEDKVKGYLESRKDSYRKMILDYKGKLQECEEKLSKLESESSGLV